MFETITRGLDNLASIFLIILGAAIVVPALDRLAKRCVS